MKGDFTLLPKTKGMGKERVKQLKIKESPSLTRDKTP